ncbi:HD domain-containing protein [candidate division KSB1 bacterium]|nr:HD domain-containing protein [candidate division KSB1 bacterium]TDI84473.1 MAG: HD domain-containing protein [Caldithrix sp.]TDI88879.1 MAG: HD domain-containing protein [Caldithrix sp.]TDJ00768.1 MAG: HD domain-containing protein [Caldithrix sp.]
MTREELIKIMPEFNLIEDKSLRENTISVWEEAVNYRNWTAEELFGIPFTLLADNVKIMFLEHVQTVCKMCVACDEVLTEAYGDRKTPINRDILVAGALLCDVGKLMEYDKENGKVVKSKHGEYLRHPFSGVGLCFKYNIPDEVMHLIAVHSHEGDKFGRSPEAIILNHADFIDFDLVKYH